MIAENSKSLYYGDWYEASRRIAWLASPCSQCPCVLEVCKYRKEDAKMCRLAHLKMRKIWRFGATLLKNYSQHLHSLEQAAMWAGLQARRGAERSQAVKDGKPSKVINALIESEQEAYKNYKEAWRECGLSAHKGIGEKQQFDASVYDSK